MRGNTRRERTRCSFLRLFVELPGGSITIPNAGNHMASVNVARSDGGAHLQLHTHSSFPCKLVGGWSSVWAWSPPQPPSTCA